MKVIKYEWGLPTRGWPEIESKTWLYSWFQKGELYIDGLCFTDHALHPHPTVTKFAYCKQLHEHIDYKYVDPDALKKFIQFSPQLS